MASERPPVTSVDEVREELRRLGYLESGLDRFVLGGRGGLSPVRSLLRVGFRVGLVGGILRGVVEGWQFNLPVAAFQRELNQQVREPGVFG